MRVAPCQITLIVLAASVHIGPGYQWTGVSAAVSAALLSAYSYDSRSLGQAVVLSDIVATIQARAGRGLRHRHRPDHPGAVRRPGVHRQYHWPALATALGARPRRGSPIPLAAPVRPAATPPLAISPAQVAVLTPDVPDSLVLTQITP